VTKKVVVVEGALEIAEDAFRNCEIGLMRVVHVEARLLDHVGDVEFGNCEVLESAD
jgi:cobyric acid synthase